MRPITTKQLEAGKERCNKKLQVFLETGNTYGHFIVSQIYDVIMSMLDSAEEESSKVEETFPGSGVFVGGFKMPKRQEKMSFEEFVAIRMIQDTNVISFSRLNEAYDKYTNYLKGE